MPDISMCADDECPSRAKCYRHKASGTKPSSFWQAYSTFWREPDAKQCSAFWPVYPTKRAAVVQSEQDTASPRADD
jgi:hypothetical protein